MRIQHNIPAMNAYRNYNTNVKSLQGNLQKLSSGYKINKAGDDAAGLAISEKMRAQITGLEVAQKNAKDGISLVQTAEGAMTEIHTMLNRMFSLAEQSANGTYDDEVDRVQLNNEFDKLKEEIDRIADASNFNGVKLLDGSVKTDTSTTTPTDTDATATLDPTISGANADGWASPSITGTGANGAVDDAVMDDLDGQTITLNYDGTTAGDNIAATGVPSGYKLIAKATNGSDVDISAAGGATFGNNANVKVPTANSAWTLELQKTDGTKVADISITAPGTLPNSTGTVGIKFDKSTAAGAAATPAAGAAPAAGDATFKGDTAGLAAFGIESVDFNGLQVSAGDKVNAEYDGANATLKITIGSESFELDTTDIDGDGTNTAKTSNQLAGGTFTLKSTTAGSTNAIKVTFDSTAGNVKVGSDINAANNDIASTEIGEAEAAAGAGAGGAQSEIRLRIGDTADDYNNLTVKIKSMKKTAIKDMTDTAKGGTGLTLDKLSVAKLGDADTAMKALKGMINYVSDARGELGATQNRLDHTINNLSTMQENIQDAESTIRDVDVAEEMMKYTKNNILVQSAQAMLAQANQLPQGVLQLLG